MMNKHVLRLLMLVCLMVITHGKMTGAFFSQSGTAAGNDYGTGSLAFALEALDGSPPAAPWIESTEIVPGDAVEATLRVQQQGTLDLRYQISMVQTGGEALLCAAFNLTASQGGVPSYSGPLPGVALATPQLLPVATGQDWAFELTLADPAASLQNAICEFDLVVRGWQQASDGTWGWDAEHTVAASLSTGEWIPPVPALVSPIDGTEATLLSDAWLLDPIMDWADVVWPTPVTFQYQSSASGATNGDGSFTTPLYTSSWLSSSQIDESGLPDGTYYWHVRASDGTYQSEWSAVWQLIIDRSIHAGYVVINEVMWMGGVDPLDEWIELRNMTGYAIDLTGWVIQNAGVNSGSPQNITLTGSIPATDSSTGYYLLANYASTDSPRHDGIVTDQVTSSLELSNSGEQLTLRTAAAVLIDQTPAGAWVAGLNGPTGLVDRSMERTLTPGDGTAPGSWYTCFDEMANDPPYWDSTDGLAYGTPKADNLSDNDPTHPGYDPRFAPPIEPIELEATPVIEVEPVEVEILPSLPPIETIVETELPEVMEESPPVVEAPPAEELPVEEEPLNPPVVIPTDEEVVVPSPIVPETPEGTTLSPEPELSPVTEPAPSPPEEVIVLAPLTEDEVLGEDLPAITDIPAETSLPPESPETEEEIIAPAASTEGESE